jgi:hypothetical protein
MNRIKIGNRLIERLACLAAAMLLWQPLNTAAVTEDTFAVLQIGARVYTNATILTKARNYIVISHATGLESVKVQELSADVRVKLGYEKSPEVKAQIERTNAWTAQTLAKIETPQVKAAQKRLESVWLANSQRLDAYRGLMTIKVLWIALGVLVALHLFCSFCLLLICRKAGTLPSVLIWLPVLQVFPLLRAARMSYWWALALLVPVLSLVPAVMWPFKIARACGHSFWVGICLLLPVLSFFAFLYLAFSRGSSDAEEGSGQGQVMSLGAA